MTLSADQQKAIEKLIRVKVGALFMEPGTGKTRTAVELINSTDAVQCLWFTPFQTKDNLQSELSKWHLTIPVKIVGIESLSSSDRLYLELLEFTARWKNVFCVVDESLKIKNRNAIRSRRIKQIGEQCSYRLILNGTPISRNIMDLWEQMEFLSPKILKMSYSQFKDTFVEYVRYKPANGTRWQEFIKDFHNLDYLYSIIDPFIYDAKLQLDKHKQYHEINYSIIENYQAYQDIKENMLRMFSFEANIFLKMTQKMQQSYCTESNKFEAIKTIIDDKTIIFCKFLKSKAALQLKYPNARIMTYGKGSLGLNLQPYNKIVFFDKTFDYAQREQAERRIYRMGQQSNCNFYTLTGDVGLEKMIDDNINKKISLSDAFKRAVANNRTEAIINEL